MRAPGVDDAGHEQQDVAAELSEHLGYEPHQEPPGGTGNTRNGSTPKTLATEHGPVEIKTPRDRKGSFEPQIVRKGQRRFEGFDDKILALYARRLSTRDIERHLAEIYGVRVGRDLVSRHRHGDRGRARDPTRDRRRTVGNRDLGLGRARARFADRDRD